MDIIYDDDDDTCDSRDYFSNICMSPIDMGYTCRYQKFREIKGVNGFIVNVHDATNYDIDLEISKEIQGKYRDVICNEYKYCDIHNINEINDLDVIRRERYTIGKTYRCRLKGIGTKRTEDRMNIWKSKQMCMEVKRLIDRVDGWVVCTISDIDIYQRLLVDITINTCKGSINLCDYILSRMNAESNPIFYPYKWRQ